MSTHKKKDQTDRLASLSPLLAAKDFRPLSSSVRVEVAALSRRGQARTVNDDHYLVVRLARQQETLATSLSAADVPAPFEESGYAYLVADGLGEGGSGSVASRVALSTIAHLALHYGRWNLRIDPQSVSSIIERVEHFYAHADAAVSARRKTSSLMRGMSTSLTSIYSAGDDLFVAHVGHSRAYLFRDGALIRLTRDHTIAPKPAHPPGRALPHRGKREICHILTDALGASGSPPTVEVEHFRLLNGDCVLVCTNGLTDAVDDSRIANVLALRRRSDEQCAMLVDMASAQGGDNITVVLAQYQVPGD